MLRNSAVFAVGLAWLASPALSAVPAAGAVLQRTAKWASELPAVSVTYALEVHDEAATGPPRRAQAVLGPARELETQESALAGSAAISLWGALLRGEGAEALRGFGVDTAVTSLYHLHRRVVVIVGARPMTAGTPQVWFDRETGAPVRVTLSSDRGMVEVLTLFSHDLPGTAGRFPGRFEWESRAGRTLGILSVAVPGGAAR